MSGVTHCRRCAAYFQARANGFDQEVAALTHERDLARAEVERLNKERANLAHRDRVNALAEVERLKGSMSGGVMAEYRRRTAAEAEVERLRVENGNLSLAVEGTEHERDAARDEVDELKRLIGEARAARDEAYRDRDDANVAVANALVAADEAIARVKAIESQIEDALGVARDLRENSDTAQSFANNTQTLALSTADKADAETRRADAAEKAALALRFAASEASEFLRKRFSKLDMGGTRWSHPDAQRIHAVLREALDATEVKP